MISKVFIKFQRRAKKFTEIDKTQDKYFKSLLVDAIADLKEDTSKRIKLVKTLSELC